MSSTEGLTSAQGLVGTAERACVCMRGMREKGRGPDWALFLEPTPVPMNPRGSEYLSNVMIVSNTHTLGGGHFPT